MTEASITLYVELKQGSRLDLEAAANASLAWSRMIKAIGHSVDPMGDWTIELESSKPGSQKIKSFIKMKVGTDLRTLIIGAVGAALFFVLKESVAWGVGEVLDYLKGPEAPAEVQLLSDEEILDIAERIAAILQGSAGKEEAVEVYDALKSDPDVTGAGAMSGEGGRPTFIIPRESFPTKRELDDASEPEERIVTERIDVILVRPVLAALTNRRWGFQTRGGSFGAPIQDESFLRDLVEGRLDVPLSQGIVMNVDLAVTEEKIGGVWRPKERVVQRVHEIKRPYVQGGLFDSLEKDDPSNNNNDGDD
ncbi:MAG: hypothetical protein JJU07_09250 [Natronohydrobacter sp.]|nr:hypothetical protein [Natronohydrobacter sp.]